MIAKATLGYARISSRKVRQVARLLKGKDVRFAFGLLAALNRRARHELTKLLKSAVANAKTKGLQEDQLYISKVVADNGPMYKRYRSSPFGRAVSIKKPTSHITIELELKISPVLPSQVKKAKEVKTVKEVKEVKKTKVVTSKTKTKKG